LLGHFDAGHFDLRGRRGPSRGGGNAGRVGSFIVSNGSHVLGPFCSRTILGADFPAPQPMRPLFRYSVVALWALAALICSCDDAAERVFTATAGAPTRTGMVPCEGGFVVGTEAGKVVFVTSEGAVRWRQTPQIGRAHV